MSILTKEGIQKILNDDWLLMDDCEGLENCTVIKELARMALAAMDSEPVAWLVGEAVLFNPDTVEAYAKRSELPVTPLYRYAQPAQTGVDDDVRNIIGLLETNEWAEHCTETVLGSRLEAEITRLVGSAQPAPVVPDEMLCHFYEVNNWPDLVRELVKHVEQLQDSAKRNVKPWEDTFPETLLPAYIERVKQADEACRSAMLNGGQS